MPGGVYPVEQARHLPGVEWESLLRFLALFAALAGQAWAGTARRAAIGRLSNITRADGDFGDTRWQDIPAVGDFVQHEPVSGVAPTNKTDVQVAYDQDHLWIRVRCWDRNVERLVVRGMARDAELENDDRVEILLDTFHDRRNAYYFATNPAGALVDGRITENAAPALNWDGVWTVKTRADTGGWTAVFQIPFKTLAFDARRSDWGFNVARYLGGLREESRWASSSFDTQFYQVSEAGALEGFEGLSQGIGLDVKPFGIGGFTRELERANAVRGVYKFGGDILYRVTPNLGASLTVNTDFAETEVDARQVNLTRFPLFFPEKRGFFLEDAGVFEFGPSADENPSFLPYFSRRIGLVNGQEAPIDVGAKIAGKVGRFDLGLLDVKTRDSEVAPAQNFTVARVKYNFFKQSYVGGLFTSGEPTGTADNRVGGIDLKLFTSDFLRRKKNFGVTTFVSKSYTNNLRGSDTAYGVELSYPNDFFSWRAAERVVGVNYNPALGFVERPGVRMTEVGAEINPRPRFWNIRQMFHVFYLTHYYNLVYHATESREIFVSPLNWQFQGGEHLEFSYTPTFERLFRPFEIHPGVVVPPGSYSSQRGQFEYNTAQNRRFLFECSYSFGPFYSGFDHELGTELAWRQNRHLSASFELQQFWVSLKEASFRTRLAEFKFDYSFSPLLTLANFVQYDTDSRNIGLQSRLRWIIKPGNELFLVVNHSWQQDTLDRFKVFESRARAKLNYTFRF